MPCRPAFRRTANHARHPGPQPVARALALGLLLVGLAAASRPPDVRAQGSEAFRAAGLREKQRIRTERAGVARPAGVAYAGDSDLFIVLPARGTAADATAQSSAALLDRFHQPIAAVLLGVSDLHPGAVAYDPRGQRLLVLDIAGRALHAIPGGVAGEFDAARAVRLEAPRVGPLRPAGMAVDSETGEVFVLDRLLRRILRFSPAGSDAAPDGLGEVPVAVPIDLGPLGQVELTGLAFDPERGHLFTLEAARGALHEIGLDGTRIATYDVSAIRLADPGSMVFAPSGDQTDDPSMLSLFVADAGAPGSRRGHVVELAWITPVGGSLDVNGIQAATAATLVRVTKTSDYSPPSPDPSGICYDSVTGRLIISDAEVEEMNIYAGKNMFEVSRSGPLQRSWTTVSWDIEPTGTAFNANNRRLYISNDDADRVWTVNIGADNLYGTSDDVRTSFKTNTFGSGDPEGIAYDRVGNRLFIADGVNEEIYIVSAGANGVFDGVPSTGDDVVTHFDTRGFGSVDPETVEWKSDTGTLLVLGSSGAEIVREVTTSGSVVSQTDISFAPLSKPSGLAYAPSSGGSGWSYYIVNRAVDNDSNPNENDGTLVEISVGGTATNTAPSVNAGPDQTITLPSQASLDGTVSDDGLPSPPALTTTWSKVSGPGTVTFGNANAVDTQASFSAAGTYVLRLTASDGLLSSTDEIQVTAQAAGSNVAPSVNAGPDQTITFPAQAALDGTVSDDGLPSPPALTTTWSRVSGPGTVTFANANAVDTQASFSVAGTYVLQLAASDGALSSSDQVQITVSAAGNGTDFRIASGLDDVEENAAGNVYTNSSDLELVFDGSNQTVGLRFTNVTIPKGATIATAYVQFQSDEVGSEVTSLVLQGQAADNAAAFATSSGNVSSRPRTTASVGWTPPAWTATNQAGPDQRTPELKTVIQEIVNRAGWASGNALVIVVSGSGRRAADSYEGSPTGAALLHVEVSGGAANVAPVVNAGPDQSITLPAQASLDGTVTDDGLPSPPSLTTTWSKVSGPGTVTFANANAVDTQASFSAGGTYVLQLAANDGQLITTDQVQITVTSSGGNTAPVVSAGPDQTVALSAQAALDGTVTDDGLPSPPSLTTTWSRVSGPGTVTFANANAVDTQASFSVAGVYVLQLTASDGLLSGSDQVQITVQSTNAAPSVSAGPDLEVFLPAQAALNGTVSDDGLPSPPALTTTWSMVSGPGTVTFANPNAVDTQASFSVDGTYVLRLTASDGALSTSDQAQVTVYPAGTVLRSIAVGTDDAEESATGSVTLNGNDLELVFYRTNQTVGLRFTSLPIPQGAVINNAAIQFQTDEVTSELTSLLIQGQAAGNPGTFVRSTGNVSARPRTAASVTWDPPVWSTVGANGPEQRTPDLKSIIQEIVNRPDWVSGNAVVIIITGTGRRTAESFEGTAAGAARLEVHFQ